MSEFHRTYIKIIISMLERILDEESKSIHKAARIMADAIENGNSIFAFGSSHSSLPVQDLVYRAGGLMLINPIYGPGIASMNTRPPTLGSAIENLEGYARLLLDATPIRENDVIIVVSVSGRNSVPIEMARIAKERGLNVIGVTSINYTNAVESRHPSGKKMIDYADIVLDNKADKGDAVIEDKRMPQKFIPTSGVTSTALLQALVASTIEELLDRKIIPPVYLAANVDGGFEYNRKLLQENKDRIFYL